MTYRAWRPGVGRGQDPPALVTPQCHVDSGGVGVTLTGQPPLPSTTYVVMTSRRRCPEWGARVRHPPPPPHYQRSSE
jgi:hypothetical protein